MTGRPRLVRGLLVLGLLLAALFGVAWLALGLGEDPTSWGDAIRVLGGGGDGWARRILLDVRLPRIVLAMLVGAALSGAGVVYQAVLRNPLADPYILGVSGGAAVGAMTYTAIVGRAAIDSPIGMPAAAFAGALVTLALLSLARVRGRTEPTTLLLVGVVLNAIDAAIILFVITTADATRFQETLIFLIGRINQYPTWPVLASLTVWVLLGCIWLLAHSHRLNLLSFGEEVADQLGVDAERTIWTSVIGASLITAAAVSFTGLVGFVGLIVPHLGRTLLGPDHRLLMPASILGGAVFLTLADTAARTVLAPTELPVGVITALVGGPFFLVLFLRHLRKQ